MSFDVTLSNNKLTIYSQVVLSDPENEFSEKIEVIQNDAAHKAFIQAQKVGNYIKHDLKGIQRMHSKKQQGFLHGGILHELAKIIGTKDIQWVKTQLKKKFLRIDFKTDLDGNAIINPETNLPIPKENQYFDLTDDEIKSYYSMWKFDRDITYPTHRLSEASYSRFISNLIDYIKEYFGLIIEAKHMNLR